MKSKKQLFKKRAKQKSLAFEKSVNSKNAVIFDLDGVISDTMDLHNVPEVKILKRYDIIISKEKLNRNYAGVPFEDILIQLLAKKRKKLSNSELKKVIKEKEEYLRASKKVKPIKGALSLIKLLKKNDFQLAVASGSSKEFIDKVLVDLNIKKYFIANVSSDEVKRGKPAPDVFLEAARRLNQKPKDCVVIEDGVNGMIGAKSAGMKCIALLDDLKREVPADKKVKSLKELKLNDFR